MDCVSRVIFVLIAQFLLLLFYIMDIFQGNELIAFLGWIIFIPLIIYDKLQDYFNFNFFSEAPISSKIFFFIGTFFLLIGAIIAYFAYLTQGNPTKLGLSLSLIGVGLAYYGFAFQFNEGKKISNELKSINTNLQTMENIINKNKIS
jgi:hypothetical protein